MFKNSSFNLQIPGLYRLKPDQIVCSGSFLIKGRRGRYKERIISAKGNVFRVQTREMLFPKVQTSALVAGSILPL